ncbi:AAA family ATPase [Pseudoduganella sp. FT25W]|uniref:AAA family ATPase n=1 Tax=Duganella alba TaxID=2666081 RepID=A0A6L5QEH4_9BURK|nr:AAA family ATPase [Duganella alba]MRX08135.1 AAA family ATPase [Duganella alba]MRX16328.1 AAA family ATPase [Duganella alba]
MNAKLRPTQFRLAGLTLVDMGALRGITKFNLLSPKGEPINIYLVMGPNGAGKTTILDAIFGAMRLLQAREHAAIGIDAIDTQDAGLQLDALVTLDDGARSRMYLLSIVAGTPGLLRSWTDQELQDVGADTQIVLMYKPRPSDQVVVRSPESHSEAIEFSEAIIERMGEQTQGLFDVGNGFPTVLYFPSDRGIRRPPEQARAVTRPDGLGYRPAQRFDADGATWASSIDNLFVWFTWLDDKRDVSCRELVNELIFRKTKKLKAVDRPSLTVPVEVEGGATHRLDQLSSGERQLVQFVVRVASHMTGSTVVLVDETEQHLHLVMRRRLINIIKEWARDYEGMSFVLTSHQADSMRILAPKLEEPGLVKGGCLVKPKFKLQHD